MTGRGRAPATPSDFFIFESFLCSFLPIQTWRGQDLNGGQGAMRQFFPFGLYSGGRRCASAFLSRGGHYNPSFDSSIYNRP